MNPKKPTFEDFLARIYVDAAARERFLADPRAEAARAGLPEEECCALEKIDRGGLEMAARSFAAKRARKRAANSWWLRWQRFLLRVFSRKPYH